MPVEEMKMLTAIGHKEQIDKIARKMVDCGCVHIVNSMEPIKDKENKTIKPYEGNRDHIKLEDMLLGTMEVLGLDREIETDFDKALDMEKLNVETRYVYNIGLRFKKQKETINNQIEKFEQLKDSLEYIKGVQFPLSVVNDLEFFSFTIGSFQRENFMKLKDNYENIPSIVYGLNYTSSCKTVIAFTPVGREEEVERIFRSLNYERIPMPEGMLGVPAEVIDALESMIEVKKRDMEDVLKNAAAAREEYRGLIRKLYTEVLIYERMQQIKEESAGTDEIFYTLGWVPRELEESLKNNMESEGGNVVISLDAYDAKAAPPTKLKNNKIFKPFEYLVKMYDLPAYDEIDPTAFFAITYSILFGSMFGDTGQGLVILLAGALLYFVKKNESFGGILMSIGLSSSIFGLLYGSIFGNEEIIEPMLLNPFHNINTVLVGGVAVGIVLTTISIVFNIINSLRRGDIEEGIFGRDGFAGLLFYWGVILSALWIYLYGMESISIPVIVMLMALLLAAMVLKQPLASLVKGRRPLHHEPPGDYYVENGFGIFETIISIMSKTISFMRVGAFALNHVGLFAAFITISQLIKNRAGSIGVLILGNLLIIGLEGMIVFIQGLRLEYYELFSRYYRGGGIEYDPVTIDEKR